MDILFGWWVCQRGKAYHVSSDPWSKPDEAVVLVLKDNTFSSWRVQIVFDREQGAIIWPEGRTSGRARAEFDGEGRVSWRPLDGRGHLWHWQRSWGGRPAWKASEQRFEVVAPIRCDDSQAAVDDHAADNAMADWNEEELGAVEAGSVILANSPRLAGNDQAPEVDEAPLPEVPVLDENAPIPLSHTSGLPFGCPLDDAEKALAFVRAVNAEFNFFRPGTWSRYWTKSIEDDIRRAGRNPDEPRRGLIIFEDEIFAAVQAEFGVRI